jgi:hypothetical protein
MPTYKSTTKNIVAPAIGKTITFKNGSYSTVDPGEIAILESHPRVERKKATRTRKAVESKEDNGAAESKDE